jgi:membrane-bound ClpP family serine protease
MKVPFWVSAIAGVLLVCIGTFYIFIAWSLNTPQSGVIALGGLALILLVVTVFLYGRIKSLEEKVKEIQKKSQ